MIYSNLLFVVFVSGAYAIQNVLELNHSSFDRNLNHPENPIWLVNFYVPWCKHSKRLNSILEEVAPTLDGRLSFGQVDCISEETLCKQFDIKAYPTLKSHRAGKFQNYEGSMDHDAIINFANNLPIIQNFSHYNELPIHKVTFLVSASSEQIQIFSSVAQRFHPSASFGILTPGDKNEESFMPQVFNVGQRQDDYVLVRLEKHIPPRFFHEEWTSHNVDKFIDENLHSTVPLLNEGMLGGFVQHGKYLVIALFGNNSYKNKTEQMVSDFTRFAFSASYSIHKDYQFCTMKADENGLFLEKFLIGSNEIIVLDYPHDIYWTKPKEDNPVNGIEIFLKGIIRGDVLSKNLNVIRGQKTDQAFPMGFNQDQVEWFQTHPWASNIYGFILFLALVILLHDKYISQRNAAIKDKKE